MFFIKSFCNTQEINKLLIQESYDDYKTIVFNFNIKHPNFQGYIVGENYDNLTEETKQEWQEYRIKRGNLLKIIINNLLNYCKNYPDDKISKNRFVNEYKEYPHRLEQNIGKVLLELYN